MGVQYLPLPFLPIYCIDSRRRVIKGRSFGDEGEEYERRGVTHCPYHTHTLRVRVKRELWVMIILGGEGIGRGGRAWEVEVIGGCEGAVREELRRPGE